jgi:hypothetical protein
MEGAEFSCMCVYMQGAQSQEQDTPGPVCIIIAGQLPVFQRFSSSKLVLKTVESRYADLNHQVMQTGVPLKID